jgi:hypothetical protein
VLARNASALQFWSAIIDDYTHGAAAIEDREGWRVFSF